ncbi:MAG: LamG domain-containing protein [Planctomycetota bacterium]
MFLRFAPLWFVTLCFGGSAAAGLITDGLIARYEFEGTLADSVGQADGTAVGTPTFGSSPVSSHSLQVSTGNYAQVTNGFTPGMSSFSISTWFRVDDFPADFALRAPIFTMQGGDFEHGLTAQVHNPAFGSPSVSAFLRGARSGPSFTAESNASVLGEWNHLSVVVNRQSELLSLYLNGMLQQAVGITGLGSIDPDQPFLFGTYDFTTARNGHGRFVTGDTQLDELLIHDRALTASEVSTLSAVPEPSSLLSFAGLCLTTVFTRRRKRARSSGRSRLGGRLSD